MIILLLQLAGIFLGVWFSLGVLALFVLGGVTALFRWLARHDGQPMSAKEMDAIVKATREEDIDAMVARWAQEMLP